MSAQQLIEMLFSKLPEFFKDGAALLALRSVPETRTMLLRPYRRPIGAFPRNFFYRRECSGSNRFTELLGGFLLPFVPLASVDHDVIAVLNAIDPNLPK